ncbi:hypothetical protein YC2023_059143 [Brassica napus]
MLWPHSHPIANHFPIGHTYFHYSSSSTLNSRVLSGCAPEKGMLPTCKACHTKLHMNYSSQL